jgi:hypothetical protein
MATITWRARLMSDETRPFSRSASRQRLGAADNGIVAAIVASAAALVVIVTRSPAAANTSASPDVRRRRDADVNVALGHSVMHPA